MHYINPVKPSEAKGLVAQVYSQIKQDFGRIVEPFTLHSPIPQLLAGVWMASRVSELLGDVPRWQLYNNAANVKRSRKRITIVTETYDHIFNIAYSIPITIDTIILVIIHEIVMVEQVSLRYISITTNCHTITPIEIAYVITIKHVARTTRQ